MRILQEKASASCTGESSGPLFDPEVERRYRSDLVRKYAAVGGICAVAFVFLLLGVVLRPAAAYMAADTGPSADVSGLDPAKMLVSMRSGQVTENLSFLQDDTRIDQEPAALAGPDVISGFQGMDDPYVSDGVPEDAIEDSGTDDNLAGTLQGGVSFVAGRVAQDPLPDDGGMDMQYTAPASVPIYIGSGEAASDRVSAMKREYAVAGDVYEYLRDEGFPDVAIAGILGNMMAECGGQTLALDPYDWTQEKSGIWYYGLCQWSMKYNPDVADVGVMDQMDYLMGNLDRNMSYFGGTLDEFKGITDAAEAARYFCKNYERGSGTEQRATNAVAAYDWILSFG